jgi:hypothetical protein
MNATYVEEVKAYRRDLLFCGLSRMGAPSTAAEVAEYVLSIAASEGHPREAFSALNPQMVAGILRGMEQAGTIQRGESRYDASKGRDQPRWCVVNRDPRYPVPVPPDSDAEPAPAPAARAEPRSPYEALSRAQMITLLQVHDDIAGAVSRLQADLDEIVRTARARLAAGGMEAP